MRHIHLPAALSLPPYHFVVFQPTNPAGGSSPEETTLIQPSKKFPFYKVSALSACAVIVAITAAALVATQQDRKPSAMKPGVISIAAVTPAPPPTKTSDSAPQIPDASPALLKATPEPRPVAALAKATPEEPAPPSVKFDLEVLAQRVAPAVFRLEVKDAAGIVTGTGTAFAISANGLAVTNFHVVDGGQSFTARTTQGAEFAVSGITAADPNADLALIQLKASSLQFLELGDSDSLKIGVSVAVFGAPQGLSGTMSDGIISARRTEMEIAGVTMPNGGRVIQITAPISAGSSGSPVMESSGKVIGVAVSGFVTLGSQNLNFVIPVEAVKKLRQDSASNLTATVGHAITGKQATVPAPKNDPDKAYFADPDFMAVNRHLQSDDWVEMLQVAKAMVAKYPIAPSAHYYHALPLNVLGLNEEAEVACKRGLALAPDNGDLWQILASTQDSQKKTKEARENWKKAAAISPRSALVWQHLASSFLRESDFQAAITPLETLRKLDMERFNQLLAVCRSVRVQSSALQSMLSHFDKLAEPEIAATASTKPEELAASLVSKFLRNGSAFDIEAELADYAVTVNPYFDQGPQQHAAILKDITTYRASWPRRSLKLIAVESARCDDLNTLEATYRLRYSATNGKTTRAGTLIQRIRYILTGNRWLVSGIQTIERVVE